MTPVRVLAYVLVMFYAFFGKSDSTDFTVYKDRPLRPYPEPLFLSVLQALEKRLLSLAERWKSDRNAKITFFESNPVWTAFIAHNQYSLQWLTEHGFIKLNYEEIGYFVGKMIEMDKIIEQLKKDMIMNARQNRLNVNTSIALLGKRMIKHVIHVMQHLSAFYI